METIILVQTRMYSAFVTLFPLDFSVQFLLWMGGHRMRPPLPTTAPRDPMIYLAESHEITHIAPQDPTACALNLYCHPAIS